MLARSAALRELGLPPAASGDEAKAAFRRLALKLHPDKNPAPDANERFQALAHAFESVMRADDRTAEAEAVLSDPLAEVFGANWARGFADGSLDPHAALQRARERAMAEEAAGDPLADAAAAMGLDLGAEELRAMLEAMPSDLRGGDGLDGLEGLDASAAAGLPEITPEMLADGGNPFKAFFDAMPEAQRGPMMALFEKTFPAFLANELEEQQLDAENELFALALRQNKLPAAAAAVEEERRELAEEFNAAAIDAFERGRYQAAAEALGEAIALDPSNAAFYGNRSLAYERAARYEEALADAESCVRCDPTYAPGYERKARALLGCADYKGAEAACRRGLLVDAEHAGLQRAFEEARAAAAAHKLEIVRAGSDVLGLSPEDYLGGRAAGVKHGDGAVGLLQ
ncbi:hypothetical protein AB1Y20_002010 [Prymnesium parvum]|uniref:J domain-containing protein n=1 Tax=Prymnesium parvum TaxID=97485 RepID=A0AB34J7W9_PRYPA